MSWITKDKFKELMDECGSRAMSPDGLDDQITEDKRMSNNRAMIFFIKRKKVGQLRVDSAIYDFETKLFSIDAMIKFEFRKEIYKPTKLSEMFEGKGYRAVDDGSIVNFIDNEEVKRVNYHEAHAFLSYR